MSALCVIPPARLTVTWMSGDIGVGGVCVYFETGGTLSPAYEVVDSREVVHETLVTPSASDPDKCSSASHPPAPSLSKKELQLEDALFIQQTANSSLWPF